MSNFKKTKSSTKIVGKTKYINAETNELEEFNVVETRINNYDCNFHKVWLSDLTTILDLMGSKKITVLNHILGNLNNDNLFLSTLNEVSTTLNISEKTVKETFKQLQDNDFMCKVRNGQYRVNPNILSKGTSNKRMNLLIKYRDEKDTDTSTDIKDELDIELEKASQKSKPIVKTFLPKDEKEYIQTLNKIDEKYIDEQRLQMEIEALLNKAKELQEAKNNLKNLQDSELESA